MGSSKSPQRAHCPRPHGDGRRQPPWQGARRRLRAASQGQGRAEAEPEPVQLSLVQPGPVRSSPAQSIRGRPPTAIPQPPHRLIASSPHRPVVERKAASRSPVRGGEEGRGQAAPEDQLLPGLRASGHRDGHKAPARPRLFRVRSLYARRVRVTREERVTMRVTPQRR